MKRESRETLLWFCARYVGVRYVCNVVYVCVVKGRLMRDFLVVSWYGRN